MIKYISDSKVFSKTSVTFYTNGDCELNITPENMTIQSLTEHVAFLQRTAIFLQSIIDRKKKDEIYEIEKRITELKNKLYKR